MNVKDAIQQYREWGWNIVPLAKGAKEPLAGLKLERWFNEQYPSESISSDLNIGLITGHTSDVAVIDVDDVSKYEWYWKNFPTGRIAKTPHGYHLFYRHNPQLPPIKKIDGGDFFNGNHYVVLPPSTFQNLSYEWIKIGELGTLPNNVFEQKEANIQIQSGKYKRQEIYELINYALTQGKPLEGAGNDTILYGSMILAGDGWNVDALTVLMKNLNNARTSPEPDHIVESMVRRATEYARSNKKPDEIIISKGVDFNVLDYSAMLDKYSNYTASWLIDQWLPMSSVVICSALPERFKTWLSVDLAISVASGIPFLNTFQVMQTGKVLVVQQEDFGPEFVARFKTVERSKIAQASIEITLTDSEGIWNYFNPYYIGDSIYFHEDSELSLDNESSLDRLKERIKELNITLCIIDPFYSLSNAQDYFEKAAGQVRKYIKAIRNETGCTFLFVHHNKKSGANDKGDGQGRNQIYGSTLLSAAMEGTWGVRRETDMGVNEIIVDKTSKTQKPGPPTKIKFHIDMSASDDKAYWLEIEEMANDTKTLIIAYLIDNGPTTYGDLFEAFKFKFGSKSTFTTFIKGLIGNGISQDGQRGKYNVEPDA